MSVLRRAQTDRMSDARNGKTFNIFSLVRIGERSGMGLSSLYGIWEEEKFKEPSIVESHEPDRTKVTVEYELDEPEVKGKTGGSDNETTGSDHEKHISGHENPVSVDVNRDFDVLMGAYRNDFRDNAIKYFLQLLTSQKLTLNDLCNGSAYLKTEDTEKRKAALCAPCLCEKQEVSHGGTENTERERRPQGGFMALTKYRLGDLIQLEDARNENGRFSLGDVRGISIQKVFIETKADMDGVSLAPCIIVRPNFFAYVTVASRNGEKTTLAHNNTDTGWLIDCTTII